MYKERGCNSTTAMQKEIAPRRMLPVGRPSKFGTGLMGT